MGKGGELGTVCHLGIALDLMDFHSRVAILKRKEHLYKQVDKECYLYPSHCVLGHSIW